MGTVIFSLDAELAWGFHDLNEFPATRVAGGREAWRRLLYLFDEFKIPATWAVVGHLFLNECDGIHADFEARDGWFERDPGGSADESSIWLAPDLVEAIRNTKVNHEIGCHAFSHAIFGDTATTEEIASAELRESRRIASEWGINLESFVFPRNKIGHRELLAEYDFRCYRGTEPERWYDGTPLRPIGKTLEMAVGRSPPTTFKPEIDEYELVNIPASLYLFTFKGLARRIAVQFVEDPVVRKAKLGIQRASRAPSNEVLHLWLHPNNLTNEADFDRIYQIFEYLQKTRETTGLNIRTMGQVARSTLDG